MAFGQAAGPPASAKTLAELAERLAEAGYGSFREARHPFGLTQRQSNGAFTQDEAQALLERLEGEGGAEDGAPAAEPAPAPVRPARVRRPAAARSRPAPTPTRGPDEVDVVTAFPDELLAEELVRRGWTCTPPDA